MEWFTVVAQIVNFLILMALLKWLLFDRIVRAMDERQKDIAQRLDEAARKKHEAEEEAESLRERNREFDQRRQQMLDDARQEADARRKEMLEDARTEVNDLRSRWKKTLRQQEDELIRELQERAADGLGRVARSALSELADAQLEQQAVELFLKRLDHLPDDRHATVAEAVESSNGNVSVATAWPLPENRRKTVAEAVRRRFGEKLHVEFETSADLICGVELRAGGQAVGWNLSGYLDTLTRDVREALEEQTVSSDAGEEQPS